MKKWKPFSKWNIIEVEQEFQLQEQSKGYALLVDWITDLEPPVTDINAKLESLKNELIEHIYSWNEQELRIKFIAMLLALVKFDAVGYQSFFEREISALYKGQTLSGWVDFVVAHGKRAPEAPYFFLHEHKREADSSNDPLGQLMIAMVTAQILNNYAQPIYGVYIIGRAWYFVVLQHQEYAVSLAFDATKEEIYQIFGILQHTRQMIDKLMSKNIGC